MIKLKVSYENTEELNELLLKLRGSTKKFKVPKESTGRYKKVYIDLDFVTKKAEKS